jgi:nascent polypeptide-associated complex subunit beta
MLERNSPKLLETPNSVEKVLYINIGSQKKKKMIVHRGAAVQDKKILSLAKKSGARKLNDIQEVNIFKDDNSVIHFKKPAFEYSPKEKVSFLTGAGENKHIKDLLPNILKQLGPKQFGFMKDFAETLKKQEKKEDKIDEAPELIEDFEEVSKKD